MIQITKEEYDQKQEEFIVEAFKLANKKMVYAHFYSTVYIPAHLYISEESFRSHYIPGVYTIHHFTNKRCSELTTNDKVDCLMIKKNGTERTYWYGQHMCGLCSGKHSL